MNEQDWTSWATTSCVGVCGEGVSTRERRCRRNMRLGPPECSRRIETCNLQPCDKNVDFLFLVDSSDYVDDCRALRRNNFSTPVTSLFINEENTPVYARMKSFMDDSLCAFLHQICRGMALGGRRQVPRQHTAVQQSVQHQYSEELVDPLPYICGGFYLDWALRCSKDKVLTPSRGDRQNVPNVLVALLSRVPTFSRPSPLLLSALSQQLKQSGTTVIAAGITPLSKLTTEAAKRGYENMLRTLACSGQEDCPTYIGSIWENGNGSPADRIRAALQSAGVL
ncbi:unnamed protein product [Clavelina lepadiformis]|uniref:VWFA domain-containing protein n=1 Tax=Clavelina lepadiformis TaxID=159417 RepID=A0ABP0FXP5_CLALP